VTLDVTHNRYNCGDGEVLGHVGETRDASCLATPSRLRHSRPVTRSGAAHRAEPPPAVQPFTTGHISRDIFPTVSSL